MKDKKVYSEYRGKIETYPIARWINDRVFNSLIQITKKRHHEQMKEYLEHDNVLIFVYFGICCNN